MNSFHKARINFIIIMVSLLFAACASNGPEVLMNPGPDNPVVMKMKHDITSGNSTPPSYSWLWWYGPVAAIAIMWAIKYFFFRKCVEEDIDALDSENKTTEEQAKSGDSNESNN